MTEGDKHVIRRDIPLEETQNPKALQQTFEMLIREYRANGGKLVEQPLSSIEDPINGLNQKLFVRPGGNDIPDVGLALVTPQATAEYTAGFFVNPKHSLYPGITNGRFHFEVRGDETGIYAPSEFFGVRGVYLSSHYDAIIVQAAANVFQRPILHSLVVEFDSTRMRELKQQGYNSKHGSPETLDKIYQPQTPDSPTN